MSSPPLRRAILIFPAGGVEEVGRQWKDLKKYVEARVAEAVAEFELAGEFLEGGLLRGAAGRAFQGWRAALAAAAAVRREALKGEYAGFVKTREGERVEKVDFVVAVMPTSQMKKVAKVLSGDFGDVVVLLTELALDLREFRHSGLDPAGVLSRYADLRDVEDDVRLLVARGREFVEGVRRGLAGG
ncbi:PaREP1 domain containing protein [Pyrobaculum calidifontis JCM 11548]|uniref:PaREP1 domain containing protein n=1 Tax=Pyrobaculum calidifontis (strain DSM 21063 / JCM 11548 / VA1) TaxID=410359 RepID=A3MVQ7_PYRCJ|nr:PaREP1 domain containing protein [Pyrobaculum calidifontis JCM 11548]